MATDDSEIKDQPESGMGLGLLKGLGVTLKTMLHPAVTQPYPHVKPDLPAAHARRDRAEAGELHGLLQVLARVPRLVHLHRRPQGAARSGRRRPRAVGQDPGPVRDRLRALHVLRHLRRGLSVRRAVLEPGVRVRRVRHRPHDPREGAPGGVDLQGPAAAAPRGRAPSPCRKPWRTRRDVGAGVRVRRARGGRQRQRDLGRPGPQRGPRGALPGGHAAVGRRRVPAARRGVRRLGADPDLRGRDRDPVPVRADAHEGADRPRTCSTTRTAGSAASSGSASSWGSCS